MSCTILILSYLSRCSRSNDKTREDDDKAMAIIKSKQADEDITGCIEFKSFILYAVVIFSRSSEFNGLVLPSPNGTNLYGTG